MPVRKIKAEKLTDQLSEKLKEKEEIEPPEWSHFVKTGPQKERPPDQPDWWHLRSASILRRVYEDGPIGVSKLSSHYGGRKDRGHPPEKFRKGSRKIIRKILQQLEEANLVTTSKGNGRKISPKGTSLINKTTSQIQEELSKEGEEE